MNHVGSTFASRLAHILFFGVLVAVAVVLVPYGRALSWITKSAILPRSVGVTNTTKKPGTRCSHFVILTLQRTGSSYMKKRMDTWPNTFYCKEPFRFQSGTHCGRNLMQRLRMSPQDVYTMGFSKWSNLLFEFLEEQGRKRKGFKDGEKCAVGFDIMGLTDQVDRNADRAVLQDVGVKKIVLRRNDTWALWISLQKAHCFGDWGGHLGEARRNVSKEEDAKLQEMLAQGKHCGGGRLAWNYFEPHAKKQYKRWEEALSESGQKAFHLTTETVAKDLQGLRSFLFDQDAPFP